MKRVVITLLVVTSLLLSVFYAKEDTEKVVMEESVSNEVEIKSNEDAKKKVFINPLTEEESQLVSERKGLDKRTYNIFELIESYKENSKIAGEIPEEINKRIEEIKEEMMKNMKRGYRYRAIAEAYGMKKPRITLEEVLLLVENFQSTGLVENEIVKIHGPCDALTGSGVAYCNYWLNNSGSERVVIGAFNGRIVYYNDDLGITEILFDPYDI